MTTDSYESVGKRRWVFVDGYLPAWGHGPKPQMKSHEAICILNTNSETAQVRLMLYLADQDPIGPYGVAVGAKRTFHLRLNDLTDPQPVPTDVDYACVLTSNVAVVVQHTRLDSRQSENGLFSTIAYSE